MQFYSLCTVNMQGGQGGVRGGVGCLGVLVYVGSQGGGGGVRSQGGGGGVRSSVGGGFSVVWTVHAGMRTAVRWRAADSGHEAAEPRH